jgi:hypothetical protein
MTATPITTDAPDAVAEAKFKLPISNETKGTMLLNCEGAVKDLISAIAKNEDIKGTDIKGEDFASLPNSITGVVMHFICEGIKSGFDIAFEEPPVSLKIRGNMIDKKVDGKKRLLTREQKNELIAKTSMSYYETLISKKEMTIEQVMFAIKDAYERKQNFEEMGYMLPEKKTAYPFWVEEGEES